MFILIQVLAVLYLGYSLIPKPQQNVPEMGTVKTPIAKEGVEIPVLFGTRDLTGPNVVWYGDVVAVAIVKEGGKK